MRRKSSRTSSHADRRRGLLRMLADSQAGFTIIEVVVASLMLTLISGAVATALISTARFSGDTRKRSQAAEIAQQDQERLRGMSIKALTNLNETRTVGPYDGTVYTVESTGQFISNTGASSCGSTGGGAAANVFIRSKVNWDANLRADGTSIRPPVVQESVVTPKAGGTLLVNVKDQNVAPVSGATVQIAGGKDSADATTGTAGCAILTTLQSPSYYVFVSKPGYVDPNGNDTSVGGAGGVSSAATSYASPDPFLMGEAGSIQATFSATGASGGQQAPSLSVGHADRANPLVTTPAAPGTPITTADGLYPFTTAYTAWAGKCPGNQPPSANATSVLVGQNQAATAVVKEPGLNVKVQYPSGTNVKPAAMRLTYNQTAGGTCTEGWVPALNAAAGPSPPATGWLASPGQPYAGPVTVGSDTYNGTYTVCASYDTNGAAAGGVRWGAVQNQGNVSFTALTTVPTIVISTTDSAGTSGPNSCPVL